MITYKRAKKYINRCLQRQYCYSSNISSHITPEDIKVVYYKDIATKKMIVQAWVDIGNLTINIRIPKNLEKNF